MEALPSEPTLQEALSQAKQPGVRLHLMGLVSRGACTASRHLHALVDASEAAGVTDCVIHAFTDGRDTAPQMGTTYLGDLERHLEGKRPNGVTVHGRYFPMDRDKRWGRVARTYEPFSAVSRPLLGPPLKECNPIMTVE